MALRFKPGWSEILFGASLAGFLALHFLGGPLIAELLLLAITGGLAVSVIVKVARLFEREVLWRLRNRMILVYLLIAVIPSALVATLLIFVTNQVVGQVAVYMVQTELDRRLNALSGMAHNLSRVPPERRSQFLERVSTFYEERYPGYAVVIEDKDNAPPDAPQKGWGKIDGIVVRGNLLFCWARDVSGDTTATILVPVTRKWLESLSPGIGDVSIIHLADVSSDYQKRAMHTHDTGEDAGPPAIPPPVNRLDFEAVWANRIPVAVWDSPQRLEHALLSVHTRMSTVLGMIFSGSPLAFWLTFGAVILAAIQLASFYLGIRLTSAVTGAVHDLYDGTERIMRGDFSHRIRVHGHDQIAEMSLSFNRMTEHLQQLLAVAKEKERLEAEVEIAREVQSQLFPRSVPPTRTLELRAVCQPARSVSGDYYDYQPAIDGKIAIVLGDVAGKGISAALLMATLQASLRALLRQCQESGTATVSPATLVSRLNHQLYLETAPEKYASFFMGIYDDATGWLSYTNAGHLPPLLVRKGSVQPLDVNGMVVGLFPSAKYDESRIQLEPGDLLVAYTDGVTEPENEFGEMFGEQRLAETLLKADGMDTEALLRTITEAVRAFSSAPEMPDDMTLLVARRVV